MSGGTIVFYVCIFTWISYSLATRGNATHEASNKISCVISYYSPSLWRSARRPQQGWRHVTIIRFHRTCNVVARHQSLHSQQS